MSADIVIGGVFVAGSLLSITLFIVEYKEKQKKKRLFHAAQKKGSK